MYERIPYLILPVTQLLREPFGIRRSAASEPSGKTPGPSRSDHCAEAPRASRRARRRARLIEPPAEATHERAVGQASGPRLEPPAEATRASRRARCRAHLEPSAEAPRASRRAIRRARRDLNHPPKRYTSDPSSKLLPRSHLRSGAQAAASGRRRYQTEPLRLFAVNPLTVGELGRRVIGEVILV